MITQENRSIQITTPLGPDVLLCTEFIGSESISSLFSFELNLVSENHNIVFGDIIGRNVTIAIQLASGEFRYFNGIISSFSQQGGGGESRGERDLASYTATMVPWPWLLSKTSDSRIFQELSVPDIIESIFSEKDFQNYELRLNNTYEQRGYCVQYRETDLNFISRLMEEEGIFYFFEHTDQQHTLILADSPNEHPPCPHQESARIAPSSGPGTLLEEDVVTELTKMQEIRIGKYTTKDFNFEIPNADLKVEVQSKQELGPGEREIYDYPGEFYSRARGDAIANLRMQAEEAKVTTISGTSNCRAFISGHKFDLTDHGREDMNTSYVLISVSHIATQPVGGSGGSGESPGSYSNSFTCIPYKIPFRPTLDTPKPLIVGAQTAIVTGPAGEEIYPDEHGRVKVQFHWDREGKKDENSSCWIRVSQVWAGAGWGAMYIPRIGHEVIVEFIEGDPDRPIITGRVYHGTNTPPYPLPDEKTKSTIKSDSSLGGGGSNEFRFEDKKGKEEIFLHGQKDWTIAIENDKNQTVGNNETISVGNNRDKTVGNNQSESIGKNKRIQVGSNHTETIGVNCAETIGVAKELTIGAAYQVTVGAAMNETIGAAKAEEIGAAKSVNVGQNSSENIGKNKSVDAGKDVTVSSGKKMSFSAGDDYSVAGNKKGVISIKDQLTIVCGKASITLKKNGDITISGKTINVKGSGNIVMKAKKILEN